MNSQQNTNFSLPPVTRIPPGGNVSKPANRFLDRAIQFSLNPSDQARHLSLIVHYLTRTFQVQADEVAFLVLCRQGRQLKFIAPHHLVSLGAALPFDPTRSVQAKALKEHRTIIENNSLAINHLRMFQSVKSLGSAREHPTQKTLTYPVYGPNSPLGVVQISRKAVRGHFADDFLISDHKRLDEILRNLVAFFQSIRSAGPRDLVLKDVV